jgi:(p)ppGpp synthase/HD superfamily hydrolase
MLSKAIDLALFAHAGQFDKAGKEYFSHPAFIMWHMDTEVEKVVALLHDVVEDSDVRLGYIRAEFGDEVGDAVDALTKRPKEKYFTYLARVKKDKIATKVKLIDLKHNSDLTRLPEVTTKDLKRVSKYARATYFLES